MCYKSWPERIHGQLTAFQPGGFRGGTEQPYWGGQAESCRWQHMSTKALWLGPGGDAVPSVAGGEAAVQVVHWEEARDVSLPAGNEAGDVQGDDTEMPFLPSCAWHMAKRRCTVPQAPSSSYGGTGVSTKRLPCLCDFVTRGKYHMSWTPLGWFELIPKRSYSRPVIP